MKESILSIAKWHEETFPDTDLKGQIEKWFEEKNEWQASLKPARHGDISELADMYIVACGLTRFNSMEAMFCFMRICDELCHSGHSTQELEHAIDTKMERNRARAWKKQDNGTYHHIADISKKVKS
nr:MAG TPA: Protein of unknown function (DUF550) [Microviridae sp.]